MKELLYKTWYYLLNACSATLIQLFILLGPVLIFALIMNFIARQNESLSYKVLGQKVYLYIFGWLGTSVHELGHAIFAIIFAHKVTEIKLFTPTSGKSLGHIKHSYTKGNPYQTLGNFFIGLGPVLLGSFLLFLVTWLLFGLNIFNIAGKYDVVFNPKQFFLDFGTAKKTLQNIGLGVWETFSLILSTSKSTWWKLILFFYLFYSVGSSISLSSSDVKGALRGFVYFVILLFIFNVATAWKGDLLSAFFTETTSYFSGFYFLIVLSIALNIVFILVLATVNFLVSLLTPKTPSRKKG